MGFLLTSLNLVVSMNGKTLLRFKAEGDVFPQEAMKKTASANFRCHWLSNGKETYAKSYTSFLGVTGSPYVK